MLQLTNMNEVVRAINMSLRNMDEPTAPSPMMPPMSPMNCMSPRSSMSPRSPAHSQDRYCMRSPRGTVSYTECVEASPMSNMSVNSEQSLQMISNGVQTSPCPQLEKEEVKLTLPEEVWEQLQNLHNTLIQATHKLKRDSINQEIQNFYKKHLRNKLPDEEEKMEDRDALNSEKREVQKWAVMDTLKQSLKSGNEMNKMMDLDVDNFASLDQSKIALVNIKSRLDYHHKQAIFYAVQSGKLLSKIKEMCIAENKNFSDTLNEWDIKWSVSHRNFLIDLFYFSRNYPRFTNVSVSLFYFKANFNKIKSIVYSSVEEKRFWRFLEERSGDQ